MALWRSGTEAAHVPLTSPVTHVHNAAMASAGMACGCQRPGLSIGAKSTSVCPVLTIPVMPAVSAVMACAVMACDQASGPALLVITGATAAPCMSGAVLLPMTCRTAAVLIGSTAAADMAAAGNALCYSMAGSCCWRPRCMAGGGACRPYWPIAARAAPSAGPAPVVGGGHGRGRHGRGGVGGRCGGERFVHAWFGMLIMSGKGIGKAWTGPQTEWGPTSLHRTRICHAVRAPRAPQRGRQAAQSEVHRRRRGGGSAGEARVRELVEEMLSRLQQPLMLLEPGDACRVGLSEFAETSWVRGGRKEGQEDERRSVTTLQQPSCIRVGHPGTQDLCIVRNGHGQMSVVPACHICRVLSELVSNLYVHACVNSLR